MKADFQAASFDPDEPTFTRLKTPKPKHFNPGWTPVGKSLIVWPIETETTTSGGIVIPESAAAREDMNQIEAIVVSIGPGCWTDQTERYCSESSSSDTKIMSRPWCKVGDRVLIAKYSGHYQKGDDGKMYRIVSDLHIRAVKEGE